MEHWEGHPVEVVRLPASKPRHTALVLPGNPGVAAWYTDFAVALREQLPDDVEVVVAGFAGQTAPSPSNDGVGRPTEGGGPYLRRLDYGASVCVTWLLRSRRQR